MAVKEITIRLREEVLHDLDEVIEREHTARDDLLARLVEEYLNKRRDDVSSRIAKITEAYLTGTLERQGSIDDIQIDAEAVEQAIVQTYGIEDPVKLVDVLRDSRW